ncbi:clathrin-coated vesicle protein [Peniophora sp. CONT]|nr:clathrin-coated vesicle protein [Peniophora sp. CONT]
MDDPSGQFSVASPAIDEALEQFIKSASADDLKATQRDLESSLLNAVTKGAPYPLPGRAIRNAASNCFVLLYTLGESKTTFDTLIACLKVVGDLKAPADKDPHKIAALYCVGEIMANLGSQVMSFMVEIATITLKLYKSSSNILLRYHALVALRKSLSTARRAATDSVFKDIVKNMRSGLLDKALPVRRAAADVLSTVYPLTGPEWTASEIEQVVALCVRSLEGADQITRQSLAVLVGKVLASSQSEVASPPPEPAKKGKKPEDEDEDPPPVSAMPGETKTIMSLPEMFRHLSLPFNRLQATHKSRVGLFQFYTSLLSTLGASYVEAHYGEIIHHLMHDIANNARNTGTRFEILLVRKLIGILLRDLVGVRMLGEQAQIAAIQELSSAYLKRWPAFMPSQTAPSPFVLAVVLKEVAGLLQQLGNAPPPVQDALNEPLVTLLAHPNHTVRVHASGALRVFCYSSPLRLPKIMITVMEHLQRDVNLLTSPNASSDISTRALGHAYGLAALVTIIPSKPLYVSYDISSKVLDMAIQLLKRAGEHDVRLAQVEVETAWTCIASLMTLGPNFVRAHLPQLLVLWRNALPKPTNKDTHTDGGRTISEWSFLLHVRETALGAIYCFLQYNSPALVTLDVSRRLAVMLSNAFLFINAFATQKLEEPVGLSPEAAQSWIVLRSRESLLRRRIFQCFSLLGVASVPDSTQITLMQSVISLVASPEGFAGSSVQAAIASSSGSFSSLWQTFDNYAYGVSSVDLSDASQDSDAPEETPSGEDRLNRDYIDAAIDDLLGRPILRSCEHDPLSVCQAYDASAASPWSEAAPAATQAVDAGLNLFASLLPLQTGTDTTRTLTLLSDAVRSPKFERNVGRKAAARVNATLAIVLTLRQAMKTPTRQIRDVFASSGVSNVLSSFLKDSLVDGDEVLRTASSEALGRLAGLADSQQFLASLMKMLVDQVVNNRDPQGRAGCCLALGAIYDHVGSLAAGPLLKTSVNILMSLSKDAHPLVHFWALHSLSRVVNAASLAYAPYVPSTLGMLFKVYVSSTHELEGGSIATVNASGDLPAMQAACKIIDAVITVLGPDIQDTWRTRTLILDLLRRLMAEDDEGIRVESIRCIQHFLLFAPDHVNVPDLITQFRLHLTSVRRPLKLASIHALYQLVQRDALLVSKIGGDALVEELFAMLDGDPSIDGVRKIITSWLQQTVVYNPSAWIDLCQKIMSRTTASQQVAEASKGGPSFDDEGASLSVGDSSSSGSGRPTSRWRTQLFALQCLHELCTIVAHSGRQEQVDLAYARKLGVPTAGLLVSRVPDLIKMAFTASTAYVTDIRLEGLIVLRDVIEIFAKTPDPDYEDALLMEQYQAPVTAALTPAFTADSTPEILASAVGACAVFVGSGIVRDVNRMGRILRLLTSALEQCSGNAMLSLGEAGEGSPNASAMLRIATLSAWARLASSSIERPYLAEVIQPHHTDLANLWIAALRDYASIRAGSEELQDSSSASLDVAYASLGRDILLPYYSRSWPVVLRAVTTFMEANDPAIRAAMDGLDSLATLSDATSSRTEPSAMFFIVFGLVYETLSGSSPSQAQSDDRNANSQVALRAMRCLIRTEYAGKALLEPTIFDELINLWYRMAMTEPPSVQIQLVETVRAFASNHAGTLNVATSISPQMHCLRICAYILKGAMPGSKVASGQIPGNPIERIELIKAAFEAFMTIGSSMGPAADEVRAVGISLYSDLLRNEASELDYTGPTLPALKALLTLPPNELASGMYTRVVHGLLSACLLNIDDMKGRQGAISSNKIKNNFLAAVLILTGLPTGVKIGEPVVAHFCTQLSEKLAEAGEMTLTAAHCAKTLFTTAASGSIVLRQCVRSLMPGMVEYLARVAAHGNDAKAAQTHAVAVGEVLKAFNSLFANLSEELRTRLLGVLLPTLTTLLEPAASSPSALHAQAIAQLLVFASASPTAFKEASANLDAETRDRMQGAVREALSSHASATTTSTAKPQISLRAF